MAAKRAPRTVGMMGLNSAGTWADMKADHWEVQKATKKAENSVELKVARMVDWMVA